MSQILEGIRSPSDLKSLDISALKELAGEVRKVLIETVSRTGGHLAPNLGAVELTIALHYVLNCPQDKIIWDVGHQTYTHKLLTGRHEKFSTLRQYKGISGFPSSRESPYDFFDVGHASTSISAASGMAISRDLRKEESTIVSVLGDGSLTAGLAFEALNHAGHLGLDLVVVLNDNGMAISRNVGALASYLNRLIASPFYNRLKRNTKYLLGKVPIIGPRTIDLTRKLKESLKGLMVPSIFFEDLGFRYFGPIDGHDLEILIDTFQMVKELSGPVLVHVITQKGKGYKPAEEQPSRFHGTGPFDVETGAKRGASDIPTYSEVFGKTICKLAQKDERVIGITAAMSDGTGLEEFGQTLPDRFFDVGIAEGHAITLAAGLASSGFRPVVAIYSTFLQRAYDQILHDVCLQSLPVVMAIDRAGIVGEDGPTHQGTFDIAYLRHLPNIVLMAPKDENELQHMLLTAINHQGPVGIRYPRGSGLGVKLDSHLRDIEIGRAEKLFDGGDVAILALGSMVQPALEAAGQLAKEGIAATVVNSRFIKPLDEELIGGLARSIGRLVTVEDHSLEGGFGSAVLEFLQRVGLTDQKVARVGLPDEFIEHGPRSVLLAKYDLTPSGIVRAVKGICAR